MTSSSEGAVSRRAASDAARQASGLSHIPTPVDTEALNASLARNYPAGLRDTGARGSVLVDVHIDERGIVRDVDVVSRGRPGTARAVLRDKDPRTGVTVEREVVLADNPVFGSAARAAMREVRFHPAMKEGRAVPFTMRMTVAFDSPPSTR